MAYPTAGSVQGRAVLRYYQTWPGGCGLLSDHVTQYEPGISHMHPATHTVHGQNEFILTAISGANTHWVGLGVFGIEYCAFICSVQKFVVKMTMR